MAMIVIGWLLFVFVCAVIMLTMFFWGMEMQRLRRDKMSMFITTIIVVAMGISFAVCLNGLRDVVGRSAFLAVAPAILGFVLGWRYSKLESADRSSRLVR